MLEADITTMVARLRLARTDLQDVEVKAAAGGFPKSVVESLSAFANSMGGTIILGLAEDQGFQPVEVDASQLASDLGAACADQLDPPIRPDIDIVNVEGRPLVVATIAPLPSEQKPCFVRSKGMDRGSYLRTHDGDRALTTYEVHVLVSSRGQPREDIVPIPGTSIADLDDDLVRALVQRLRSTRGPVFTKAEDTEVLRLIGVLSPGAAPEVTLAGILALGRYPQRWFPQLDVTFVAFPDPSGEPLPDGTRFLDNQSIDGPIPSMVVTAMAALRRNMTRRGTITGAGRMDHWEYPDEVLREVVTNALMHRDYHPLARGSQVRVELYPDRVEIKNPGGLHGAVAPESLLAEPVTSSRNATLSKLLEDVAIPETGRTVAENRGSGLVSTAASLRNAGLEPPEISSRPSEFKIIIRNHGLLDPETLEWLAQIETSQLSDRQHLALAFLRRNHDITNQRYRTLTGATPLEATRDLTGLATSGLLQKSNDRRWTVWSLADSLPAAQPRLEIFREVPESTHQESTQTTRRSQLRELLLGSPRTTRELADSMGVGPEGVRYWLRKMEADGEVQPTSPKRSSRHNHWKLIDGNAGNDNDIV